MPAHLAGAALALSMLTATPPAPGPDAGGPSAPPKAAATQEGLKSLVAALSGSWTLAARYQPSQEGAAATESTGSVRWSTAVDGQVLLEDEHLPLGKTDLKILGLIWWDDKKKALAGLLCSSRSPRICDPKASLDDIRIDWDGSRLLIEELEHQHDGSVLLFRESYGEITARSYVQLGEIGPTGGPFRRVFTVRATRSRD
jgi:hypothetical protein